MAKHYPTRQPATPLDQERRFGLPTAEAGAHLNRQQQTLRHWASTGTGPIQPVRVAGRLIWPTTELRRVLGVKA